MPWAVHSIASPKSADSPDGNRHAVYKVSYLEGTDKASEAVVRISYGASEAECAAERGARVLRTVGGRAAPVLYDFRCIDSKCHPKPGVPFSPYEGRFAAVGVSLKPDT